MGLFTTIKQEKDKTEKKQIRQGYGDALFELGKENEQVVALSADLAESNRANLFQEEFPKRFFEVGVAEQNMMGISAGLALSGKIPFASSYAVFSPGRNWDQLRVSVCYAKANVKFVSSHSGLSVGPDGATHQSLEDIAITRVLPNLTVISPADYYDAFKATKAAAKWDGPVYIRCSKNDSEVVSSWDTPFEIGKANVLKTGSDITIIGTGQLVSEAVKAAKELEKNKISAEVINLHTIKPLDTETILKSIKKTNNLITIEDHQKRGGMGSAVTEFLAENYPVKSILMGVDDTFGESGTPEELYEKYGLTYVNIISNVKKLLKK